MLNKKVSPSTKEKLIALDLEAMRIFSPSLKHWFSNRQSGLKFRPTSLRRYQPYVGVTMHLFTCDCQLGSDSFTREISSEELMGDYNFGLIYQR